MLVAVEHFTLEQSASYLKGRGGTCYTCEGAQLTKGAQEFRSSEQNKPMDTPKYFYSVFIDNSINMSEKTVFLWREFPNHAFTDMPPVTCDSQYLTGTARRKCARAVEDWPGKAS